MSTITQAVEQRADRTPSKRETLRHMVEANAGAIGMSLPSGFSRDRFVRLLLTAANTTPKLFDCDPRSFLAAGVQAAQLGLEPNDARGLAYIIPYGNKATLVLGYRGLMDLARRSGMVGAIHAFAVYEGDEFTYSLGMNPDLRHVPHGEENPDKLTHAYAVAKVNGEPQFVVVTRSQIEAVRSQSQTGKSKTSPWATHYEAMAIKTAIRRLCKYLPLTVEAAQALEVDDRPLDLTDLGPIGHSVDPDTDDVIDIPDNVDPATGELFAGSDE